MSPTKAVSGSSRKRTRSSTAAKMPVPSEENNLSPLRTIEENDFKNNDNSKKDKTTRVASPEHPIFTAVSNLYTSTIATATSSSSSTTAQSNSNALVKLPSKTMQPPVIVEVWYLFDVYLSLLTKLSSDILVCYIVTA
jgi:hypothetical protein